MSEKRQPRKFAGAQGKRQGVPIWLGIYGPSGGGKTYSALRLAQGIQQISGGKIGLADTESGRALHYADEFDFIHYPFDPPFDPLSYRDMFHQMRDDGITIAIIDSASHEHEGPGGVLEMHEEETEKLAKQWGKSRDAVKGSGWIRPKSERLKMIDAALRTKMHMIFCFRAQNKMDFKSKNPTQKGFMPIGGEILVYQMAMTALLLPGAKGHPTWQSKEIGEREMIKLPHWAQAMLRDGHPLDEHLGARLAQWAQGTDTAPATQPAPEQTKPPTATREERAEFLRLFGTLSDNEREKLGISKVITNIADVHTLAPERVRKGITIMQRAVEAQKEPA